MAEPNQEVKQRRVKTLQRKCVRALQLHADLAEAGCELLIRLNSGGVSARDRRRLTQLLRQESAAITAYHQAKMDLITALSVSPASADQRICPVVSVMT